MKVRVDTGATNSIIQQSSLSKARHRRIYPVQQQFFLANKISISIIGYVTLEIKIQHIKTHVTAAITKTLCCDVILGEDWIRHYQVTINGFTNKIEVLGSKAAVPLQPSSIIPNDINSCVNYDNLYHKNYCVHYGNQYYKNYCINHHNRYYKSYRVNCGSQYHKINKPIPNQSVPKRLPCVNTINNSIQVISSIANDIKTTLDQAIAAPIHLVTNLTKDNKHKFKWGEEQRQAVQQLKQIITGPDLVLGFLDPKLPYVLSTDASRVGLGAVLKQITENGRIKINYYLSRVLTNAETRYSTTELEALAIVWAITKLRPYLLGIQPTALINVITRSAARANNSQQDTEAKLTSVYNTRRKTTQLQEKNSSSSSSYTNMPSTASSSSNTNDKSMLPLSLKANDSAEVPLSSMGFSMRRIKEEQSKDPEIQEKKKNLSNNQDYEIINGILYKLVPRGKRKIKLICIPKTMINQVLFLHHDHHTAAHMGVNKTTTKLVNKRTKLPGKMNITPITNEVMGLVGMDYWGPTMQPTRNGNKYVITMTDYLSKYVFAKAVSTNSAQEAAEFFLDVCCYYGAPTKLITDQGPHFIMDVKLAQHDELPRREKKVYWSDE
ncbi:unnamed protein product [Rotaria sordida]|uniref:Integrase catalytic domain-containing protein n=1 Tax=Rotaria sordida TaxID=392033 RepID=A0A819NGK9_9BILA|nr:unnamed protein product [Rotaria sordida]CAF3997845.1 unnamed protein product [Rotaria sordida]